MLDVQLEQPVRAVVADDELGADVVAGGRPERLDRVHAPPSPVNPTTVLSGCASLTPIAPGNAHAERSAARQEVLRRVGRGGRYRTTAGELVSASSKMIASSGSCAGQLLHEPRHVQRDGVARLRGPPRAPRRRRCLLARQRVGRAPGRRRAAADVRLRSERVGQRAPASASGSATRPRSTGWFLAIS